MSAGGKVEYRRALAESFLFKYFVHVAMLLEEDAEVCTLPNCTNVTH